MCYNIINLGHVFLSIFATRFGDLDGFRYRYRYQLSSVVIKVNVIKWGIGGIMFEVPMPYLSPARCQECALFGGSVKKLH